MNQRPALLPIDQIVGMLRDAADRLARDLLPGGHRDGQEWREARTGKGGLGDSLSVNIGSGPRRGVWAHHAAGESGDALDLICYLRTHGDKKAAIGWAKAWLGIEGVVPAAVDDAALVASREQRAEAGAAEARRRRAAAQAIYLSGSPIGGTAVERYLAGRGLDVRRLAFPLRALRFHPALWDRHTRRNWPAMVAAVSGGDGAFLATHMTYLEALDGGAVRKAPIADPERGGAPACKRVLGSFRGGAIRLWRGMRVDPETGEFRQARRLAGCKPGSQWVDLTEGIEDGLTVALADAEARVLVAVSVSNMGNLVLPAAVGGVVLWRDNDAPGSKAAMAIDAAAARFAQAGLRVAECRPPAGVKDANEMAQAGAA